MTYNTAISDKTKQTPDNISCLGNRPESTNGKTFLKTILDKSKKKSWIVVLL